MERLKTVPWAELEDELIVYLKPKDLAKVMDLEETDGRDAVVAHLRSTLGNHLLQEIVSAL